MPYNELRAAANELGGHDVYWIFHREREADIELKQTNGRELWVTTNGLLDRNGIIENTIRLTWVKLGTCNCGILE